jgi:hypothetical protein
VGKTEVEVAEVHRGPDQVTVQQAEPLEEQLLAGLVSAEDDDGAARGVRGRRGGNVRIEVADWLHIWYH